MKTLACLVCGEQTELRFVEISHGGAISVCEDCINSGYREDEL